MSDLIDNAESLTKTLSASFFDPRMAHKASEAIGLLDLPTRHYVLNRTTSLARTQPEIAYQFALHANRVIKGLNREACESWLQQSLEILLANGQHAALAVMKDPDAYILECQQKQHGLCLGEIQGILQNIINGLGGRRLGIEAANEIYTDSDNLYLPAFIDYFSDKNRNFAVYRAMLAHLWAQNVYGTWRRKLKPEIATNPDLLHRFHFLETLRLNAAIKRDFSGLWRQIQNINQHIKKPIHFSEPWCEIKQQLENPKSNVNDSLQLLEPTSHLKLPQPFFYQGILRPDLVEIKRQHRLQNHKLQFQDKLAKLAFEQLGLDNFEIENQSGLPETPHFKINQLDSTKTAKTGFGLEINGIPVPLDNETNDLITAIIQEQGELPPDYLRTAPSDYYNAGFNAPRQEPYLDSHGPAIHGQDDLHFYPEWDSHLKTYRKNWCVVREKNIAPDFGSNFVNETLHKYRGHIKSLQRSFEALRDEYKTLKRQPDGENLDIDALVEAISDVRSGMEMTQRIFRKASRVERNIAVVFMVDMSSSTRGWINLAQREALVLLTETLQSLDDRYAIYGFSGITRKHCEIYPIKSFNETYNELVKARIASIQPGDYTRMGATIRHLTALLDSISARSKLLITLTDGKPDDSDSYRGQYGIEDTRMALLEAQHKSIHPFCITIDEQARDYLPHMYGKSNYVVIDDVAKLPFRISGIYRGLTS